MFARVVAFVATFFLMVTAAEARRVALVIGQNAYPGGASATIGLPPLDNLKLDAARMADLLWERALQFEHKCKPAHFHLADSSPATATVAKNSATTAQPSALSQISE